MITATATIATELAQIDACIRLNFMLVRDGPCRAVDYRSVWSTIDALLDARLALMARRK